MFKGVSLVRMNDFLMTFIGKVMTFPMKVITFDFHWESDWEQVTFPMTCT